MFIERKIKVSTPTQFVYFCVSVAATLRQTIIIIKCHSLRVYLFHLHMDGVCLRYRESKRVANSWKHFTYGSSVSECHVKHEKENINILMMMVWFV